MKENKLINKKENRGITLVALVITIIVLIILAGVSINAVMNGGLIGNAKNARDDFNKAKQDEAGKLSDLEADMEDFNIQTPYKLKNGFITGIVVGETVKQFESKLPEGYEVYSMLDAELTDSEREGQIATGMILKKDEEEIGKIVIYGDFNYGLESLENPNYADGDIEITDCNMIETCINEAFSIDDWDKIAADVNHDNIVSWKDLEHLEAYCRIRNESQKPKIDQNVYAANSDTIIVESKEKSKQNWVNSLGDTIKTKFEWQKVDEEKNYDGYYILKIGSGETVETLLQKLNKKVAIVSNATGNILESTDSISVSDKIMLYPDFEATTTNYMLELGIIQIVE